METVYFGDSDYASYSVIVDDDACQARHPMLGTQCMRDNEHDGAHCDAAMHCWYDELGVRQ